MQIQKYIDHTLLHPTATKAAITQLCNQAKEYGFFAVCVNSCYIEICKELLYNTPVKIVTVIGFPLGATTTKAKVEEAKIALKLGADEIDMVINIGLFKDGYYKSVEEEIKVIKKTIGKSVLKVIIETCFLTNEEIKTATQLAINAGAEFVKTSTGFGTYGARIEDIETMYSVASDKIQIKASGGIKDYQTMMQYINNGVTRIGTSSGLKILSEANAILDLSSSKLKI